MDRVSQGEDPVGLPAALLWMTLLLLLVNAGILLVSHLMFPQSSGWALFGGWLLDLVVIFVLAGWIGSKLGGRGVLPILCILFAVYALVYGLMGGHIPRLFKVRETPVIPVRDADQDAHRSSDVFHFSDGRIELKYLGTRTLGGGGRGMKSYYRCAPLVPADWKPSDPVTAWVVDCGGDVFLPASWKEDWRGGYEPGLDSIYRELVRETAAGRSLNSRADVPIVIWSQDPMRDFRRVAAWQLGFLLAIDLVGWVAVILAGGKSPPPAI
jgi:hypothetical protein